MILWSGYGFLIFVIVFVDSLIAELITKYISNNENLYSNNYIPLGCSFLLSSIIIVLFSKYFEKKKREKKSTRIFDWVTISKGGHLFFIPFDCWYWYAFMAVKADVKLFSSYIYSNEPACLYEKSFCFTFFVIHPAAER